MVQRALQFHLPIFPVAGEFAASGGTNDPFPVSNRAAVPGAITRGIIQSCFSHFISDFSKLGLDGYRTA